jgi:hypothetical protein
MYSLTIDIALFRYIFLLFAWSKSDNFAQCLLSSYKK